MFLSIDRIKHSLSVAKKMKSIVSENPDRYVISPEDAFTIGILHDIGYEFVENQKDHAHKGGLLLKSQGYKYWKEIYYHGEPQQGFDSKELWLLNYADMTTSPTGEYMTIQQRIEDISNRYWETSVQKQDAEKLAMILMEKGY